MGVPWWEWQVLVLCTGVVHWLAIRYRWWLFAVTLAKRDGGGGDGANLGTHDVAWTRGMGSGCRRRLAPLNGRRRREASHRRVVACRCWW